IEVFFPADRVEFTGSLPKTYEHRSEEHGRWLRLDFCPRCGISIGVTAERRPGQRGLNEALSMIVRGSRLAGTSGRNRRSTGSKYLLMFPVGYLGAPRQKARILLNVRYWW